jgi:hypothetical protein
MWNKIFPLKGYKIDILTVSVIWILISTWLKQKLFKMFYYRLQYSSFEF